MLHSMEAFPADKTAPPFGRYLLRERIAQGGMGEVFVAVAVGADGFEKPVVVKRLLPKFASRPEVASLLSAEAKLMTRLVHPNIVQVIDFGRGQNDDYFLVMELVSGTDLGRFCKAYAARGSAVPVSLALFVVSQVLRGLAHAHGTASTDGKRLVHRDISPGNVLVSKFGEVKVADFGVALVARSTDGGNQDSWFVGKPAYMAPEQLEQGPVDERADIYAVGAVLYEVLTGASHRREAAGGSPGSEISDEVRNVLLRVASADLAGVILRALAPRREDRYANAREMARAIDQIVEKGEKVASADDLAAAVSEITGTQPRGRPVVVLSGEGLAAGTELTHLGPRGEQGFAVKMQDSPRAAAAAGGTAEVARRPASRPWVMLAVLGMALALATFVVRSRAKLDPHSSDQGLSPVASAAAAMPTSESSETRSAPAEQPAPVHVDPAVKVAHSSRPHEPPPGCHGQLHLYATHGWVIAGGPGPVQAPGRYEWPCGTYTLRAVSRLDAKETMTVTVTIREAAPGVVDLR
jgi:serine/threonine-protein kinase